MTWRISQYPTLRYPQLTFPTSNSLRLFTCSSSVPLYVLSLIIANKSTYLSRSIVSIKDQSNPKVMSAVKQFKALVLGSGQGGTPLTMALAAAGHRVALVEGRHIGIQSSLPPLSILLRHFPVTRNHLLPKRHICLLPSFFVYGVLPWNGDFKATTLTLIKAGHASTKAAPPRKRW